MRHASIPRRIRKGSHTAVAAISAVMALGLLNGCDQSSTAPTDSSTNIAPTDVSALSDVQAGLDLSSDQGAAMAAAHAAWQQKETAWAQAGPLADEPPVFAFVAASAGVLNGNQLNRLLVNLHGLEAERLAVPAVDATLLTTPGRNQAEHGRRDWRHPRPGPFGDLGLSPEQVDQIRTAHKTLRAAIHDLAQQLRDGAITAEQFEAGVDDARAAYETALQTILSAEQYAQLQEARRSRLIAGLEARLAAFDRIVARHVQVLDRILGLDDTQVADITTILMNTRPDFETVLANLQDGSSTPQEASEALKQIAVDAAAAIRATLTDEQAAIFDHLKFLRRPMPC